MTPLISLARAKMAPGFAGLSDEYLTVLIAAASESIENYLRRAVIQRTIVETHDGEANPEIMLNDPGLVSITSIAVRDSDDTTQILDSTDFYLDTELSRIWFKSEVSNVFGWRVFPRGFQNITVTYVAGLAADLASVPAIIQQAVVEVMLRIAETSKTADTTATSETLDKYSISRGMATSALSSIPAGTKSELAYYRNRL